MSGSGIERYLKTTALYVTFYWYLGNYLSLYPKV